MRVVVAGLVIGQAVRVHVIHHLLAHEGRLVALGHGLGDRLIDHLSLSIAHDIAIGILLGELISLGLFLITAHTGIGIGLGLPGLIEQLGDQLLLILCRSDGIHLVHGLALGGLGQFQLQLGEHQLQARGGAQFTERNRRRRGKINLAHIISLCRPLPYWPRARLVRVWLELAIWVLAPCR